MLIAWLLTLPSAAVVGALAAQVAQTGTTGTVVVGVVGAAIAGGHLRAVPASTSGSEQRQRRASEAAAARWGRGVNMNIDWSALGEVFVVSFGAAVVVILLFSSGIRALAGPAATPAPGQAVEPVASRPTVAVLCFLACALVVGYGLYLIISK